METEEGEEELQVLSKSDGIADESHEDSYERGILSPLSIESSGYQYPRRPTFHLPSIRCHQRHRRAALSLAITTLFVASCFAAIRKFFPTYLPSVPTLVGGKSKSSATNAICLPHPLSDGNRTSITEMNLNRKAPAFSGIPANLNGAHGGFLWNDGDAKTTKWRPQGVSTINLDGGRRFVLVSWYGRKDQNYEERGARTSFVDVSNMHSIKSSYSYRHVLLVDENFCTLPSIHAGGIEHQNGKVYVADSRKGQQAILVFDVATNLYEIPKDMQGELFEYRYILRSTNSFHVPIKPSFISFDIDLQMFVVGTYTRCGNTIGLHTDSKSCMDKQENRLVWFAEGGVSLTSPEYCYPFFSEMQGAVSARSGNSSFLWVVSSYGPYADSHLHIIDTGFDHPSCTDSSLTGGFSTFRTLHYPPGLEDLHIEKSKGERYMWMLTGEYSRKFLRIMGRQIGLP